MKAENWRDAGNSIQSGSAICVPDDGSGPMEGFYDERQGRGMVAWGEHAGTSDWVECNSLADLFKRYVSNH